MSINYKPRIFISSISKLEKDSPQKKIKTEIIRKIKAAGFEPQIFMETGLPLNIPWNFETAYETLKRCDGAVILGLSRWQKATESGQSGIPTEYNHYEGALAASLKLPLLVLAEEGIEQRGVFYSGTGHVYTNIPSQADANWFNEDESFISRFNAWERDIKNRFQVFVGYSGEAKETAGEILRYLKDKLKLQVKEYRTNFMLGATILDEIENAAQACQCGIFLFTCSDKLLDNSTNEASPRDNVIFEAGYFMKARGKERSLIILEKGAKMPVDLGGSIYLPLKDRNNVASIFADIEYFLEQKL